MCSGPEHIGQINLRIGISTWTMLLRRSRLVKLDPSIYKCRVLIVMVWSDLSLYLTNFKTGVWRLINLVLACCDLTFPLTVITCWHELLGHKIGVFRLPGPVTFFRVQTGTFVRKQTNSIDIEVIVVRDCSFVCKLQWLWFLWNREILALKKKNRVFILSDNTLGTVPVRDEDQCRDFGQVNPMWCLFGL